VIRYIYEGAVDCDDVFDNIHVHNGGHILFILLKFVNFGMD